MKNINAKRLENKKIEFFIKILCEKLISAK